MDLFAGLDGLDSSSNKNKKVSLAEQYKIKEDNNRKTVEAFDGLDLLGSSSSTTLNPRPAQRSQSPIKTVNQSASEDDDLFGIFNSAPPAAPAPQSQPAPQQSRPPSRPEARSQTAPGSARPVNRTEPSFTREPFSEFSHSQPVSHNSSQPSSRPASVKLSGQNPRVSDHSIAQLVDMGFEPDDAGRALEAMNGSVRGAVNWLMAEAQGLPLPQPKPKGLSSTLGSGDFTEFQTAASQLGSSMFSKASSFFAKGRKEIEKAYSQYNNQYTGDPSQPAWLKDKAKHDARRSASAEPEAASEPELPRRPARRDRAMDQMKETHVVQPKEQPRERERPSRAELFRQRQRERNVASPAGSNASPLDSPVTSIPGTPVLSMSTQSVPNSSSRNFTPETTPEIDLLNLTGPSSTSMQTSLSSTENDLYTTSRELGSEAFRKGNYEEAIEHYTAALQVVPETNILRALLLSNRSAAYLKAGNLRGAFDDTMRGISVIPNRGVGIDIGEKGTSMSDIWVKLVTRNAQAAENMEKFEAALKSWQLLLDNGYASPPVLDAKRRCLRALDPNLVAKQERDSSSNNATGGVKKSQRRGWGTTGATPTSAEGKAALERVKANHNKQADEERQKELLQDKVGDRVDSWRKGNENNLRALLSTLQNVLWESCDWTPVALSDLVIPKKVRIVYMKAVSRTHPDKVPASAPVEARMISQSVFVVIQSAWEIFRQENNM